MFLEKPLLIWLLSLRFCKLEEKKEGTDPARPESGSPVRQPILDRIISLPV